jgi:NAD(P)-dependent dehydrogenase (short-subunit alcohol dehydrogenase family)
MKRVQDKVAFVTGGAMGMGKSHAETLAAEGAYVFVADRDAAAGKAVVEGIVAKGGKAEFLTLDVSKEGDWSVAVDTVKAADEGSQRIDHQHFVDLRYRGGALGSGLYRLERGGQASNEIVRGRSDTVRHSRELSPSRCH